MRNQVIHDGHITLFGGTAGDRLPKAWTLSEGAARAQADYHGMIFKCVVRAREFSFVRTNYKPESGNDYASIKGIGADFAWWYVFGDLLIEPVSPQARDAVLRSTAKSARRTLEECVGRDYRGADLRDINAYGVDFSSADFYKADLRYADLREADLSCANLKCADLRGADITGADLAVARKEGANFDGALASKSPCRPWVLKNGVLRNSNKEVEILRGLRELGMNEDIVAPEELDTYIAAVTADGIDAQREVDDARRRSGTPVKVLESTTYDYDY